MLKSNIILAIIVCLELTYVTTQVFRPGTNLFFQYPGSYVFYHDIVCLFI